MRQVSGTFSSQKQLVHHTCIPPSNTFVENEVISHDIHAADNIGQRAKVGHDNLRGSTIEDVLPVSVCQVLKILRITVFLTPFVCFFVFRCEVKTINREANRREWALTVSIPFDYMPNKIASVIIEYDVDVVVKRCRQSIY